VRIAVSTLSTASTALSVTRSTLSSWLLTLSTLPPTLLMTGRISRSTPEINEERRPTVPPRRTSRYDDVSPTASRNTARASRQRSPHVNAATSIRRDFTR